MYREAAYWCHGFRCIGDVVRMRDHTSLIVWQKARQVALGCASLARSHWQPYAAPGYEQLTSAALSVQLNLAEGYALWTVGKQRQHFRTAYGSCVETTECLGFLRDAGAIPTDECERLTALSKEVQWMLLALIRKREGP